MRTKREVDFARLPGLTWHENGQSSLSGALFRLCERIDQRILSWVVDFPFQEHRFPPFLRAAQLHKLDYFKSFPHLLTVPVVLNDADSNLKSFAESPLTRDGCLDLPEFCAPKDVLTPAACYHFYDELEGSDIQAPLYLTTLCTCFRREKSYQPLRRQSAFAMRELVCVGGIEEVKDFLSFCESVLVDYFRDKSWPVNLEVATDPFFNPASNPKYLLQKLDPVKREMVYRDDLAIGSLNFHRNFFGDTFNIKRSGESIFSCCVAFGLERWIYAILAEYGEEETDWQV